MQKGFAPVFILVGMLLILGIIGGTYYLIKNTSSLRGGSETTNAAILPILSPSPSASPSAASDETATWKTYINKDIGFEIKYPENLKTKEFSNGNYPAFYIYAPSNIEYLLIQSRLNSFSSIEQEKQSDIENYRPWGAQYVGQMVLADKEAIFYKTEKAQITEGNEELQGKPYQKYVIYLTNQQTIGIEYFGTGKTGELFEKILSTFKFIP